MRPLPFVLPVLAALATVPISAQEEATSVPVAERLDALESRLERALYDLDAATKKIDDLLWFERVDAFLGKHFK